jgi:hypothetical protein
MSRAPTTAPQVYRAISAVIAEFAKAGIAKAHTNIRDQYQYRSLDDLLNRLAPLLVRHKLCILPRVLTRECESVSGERDELLTSVRLEVAFDLVSSRDGSCHTIQSWGEALDASDKGTAKAMSAAYKSAMLELFCVPVANEDADASSHRLKASIRETEPVQGWAAWSDDILDIIGVCESGDALDRVRTRQGGLLTALKKERPELYAKIGEGFADRSRRLAPPKIPAKTTNKKSRPMETVDG